MKKAFSKTAVQLIGDKINEYSKHIDVANKAIETAAAFAGVIMKYNGKCFNAGVMKKINTDLNAAGAPFSLEIYKDCLNVAHVRPEGTKLEFYGHFDEKRPNYVEKAPYLWEIYLFFDPSTNYRIDAAKTAGTALLSWVKATKGDIIKVGAQIERFKSMVAPLQRALDAFSEFAKIEGSAYIYAEEFIKSEFITTCDYSSNTAAADYFSLRDSMKFGF